MVLKNFSLPSQSIFQNITELERVSSELNTVRHLYNQLDTIIETSFDGVMITDVHGRGVRINQALARLTGLDDSYFIGKRIDDLFRKGIFKWESVTIKALQEKRTVTAYQYINPTGKEVLVTGNPVFDHLGKVTGVITNVRDITELNQLKEKLQQTQILNEQYHTELYQLLLEKFHHDTVIVENKEMQKILYLAIKLAQTDSTVLITGESGVGKEIVARVIHNSGDRAKYGKFVQINCCAIPETLLEAELFGYEAGAFTGAKKQGKMGLFELANKGSIMLDEIAEMPLSIQGKLLRVLQEQVLYRLGGTKPIKVDVRVIAAANKDLWECVREGTFREDLYYRINVIPIKVPPLRQRIEDIAPLALHFLKKCKEKHKIEKRLDSEALTELERYSWPGNVREMENIIERLVILYEGDVIQAQQVKEQLLLHDKKTIPPVTINYLLPIKDAHDILDKELLDMAINRYTTSRKAAKALGISHSSVIRKMARYNIKTQKRHNASK
ncbi:sigma-54 interaction domain-containing protein [Desulfoscipio gibsoniae]|uniref:HTH-type transcriptional regulatory protein TyrR n=1 Tax=Desulfoscipio gibsoniae DSM 7213 TaxID=767817 RepID=R4KH02_9FIRM|nr:sigma 54-interacting transcriptional regulator [Desulfoscipio gibsoniae]AGL00932.1 PAS domain S-box [Desulfoscipio gibsoniae DSM 7213]